MLLITSIYASDVEIKTKPNDWSSLSRKPNLHFLNLKCNSHRALMKYLGGRLKFVRTKAASRWAPHHIANANFSSQENDSFLAKWFVAKFLCTEVML